MTSMSEYVYECVILCSTEPYGPTEEVKVSFKSGNQFLSYRDIRTEVINRTPDKYQVFHSVTYKIKEGTPPRDEV